MKKGARKEEAVSMGAILRELPVDVASQAGEQMKNLLAARYPGYR